MLVEWMRGCWSCQECAVLMGELDAPASLRPCCYFCGDASKALYTLYPFGGTAACSPCLAKGNLARIERLHAEALELGFRLERIL